MNQTEKFLFDCHGFIHIPQFLSPSETALLLQACIALEQHALTCEASAARFRAPTSGFEFWQGEQFGYYATNEMSLSGVQDAAKKGAKVLTGGKPTANVGYYYPPTVLSDVPADAHILKEEVFGPVAPVVPFKDEQKAIELANATEYGLVSYLYTKDLARGMAISEQLESGMVGLNRGLVSDPAAPFGGTKQSGLGREGSYEGMMEYMEKKYVAVEW